MPILEPHTLEIFSHSPEQTRRVGMRLGQLLQRGDLLCLEGDLGAGKTTFVQGIARGWGSLDEVSSPTFVLVNQYRRPDGIDLFHLDAYRLGSLGEAEELDLDDMLAAGTLIVEWADRIRPLFPDERLWIHLQFLGDHEREIRLLPHGGRPVQLADALRQAVFGVA